MSERLGAVDFEVEPPDVGELGIEWRVILKRLRRLAGYFGDVL